MNWEAALLHCMTVSMIVFLVQCPQIVCHIASQCLWTVIWTTTAAKNKLPLKVESQASEVPDLSFLSASSIDSVVLLPGCAPTPELVAQVGSVCRAFHADGTDDWQSGPTITAWPMK